MIRAVALLAVGPLWAGFWGCFPSGRRCLISWLKWTEIKQRFGIGRHRFWELMQQYGQAVNLPPEKRHPHCLRHTCATDLAENKVPLERIQAWTRHRSLGSLGVYLRPTQQQVNTAVLAANGGENRPVKV